jgi:hypothetical protein
MELERSLTCSQKPANGPYPKPYQSTSHWLTAMYKRDQARNREYCVPRNVVVYTFHLENIHIKGWNWKHSNYKRTIDKYIQYKWQNSE